IRGSKAPELISSSQVEPTGEPAAVPVPGAAASGSGGSGGGAGGGTGETANSQRSISTPFLTKTYRLVDDPDVDDLILWNEDGSVFIGFRKVVPDRWEFANDCFKRGEKALLWDIQRGKIVVAAAAPSPTAAATVAAIPTVVRTISPSNSGEEQVISSTSSPVANAILRTTSCTTTPKLLKENEMMRRRTRS
ncbi:unnamed protein product, partial [Linum tenue]